MDESLTQIIMKLVFESFQAKVRKNKKEGQLTSTLLFFFFYVMEHFGIWTPTDVCVGTGP